MAKTLKGHFNEHRSSPPTRLHPLTAEHAKPALPLVASCRTIDFVLSNLVNSRISPIHVPVQYKPQSLIEHVVDDATFYFKPDRRGLGTQ